MEGMKDLIDSTSSSGKSTDPVTNKLNVSLNHLGDRKQNDLKGTSSTKLKSVVVQDNIGRNSYE